MIPYIKLGKWSWRSFDFACQNPKYLTLTKLFRLDYSARTEYSNL